MAGPTGAHELSAPGATGQAGIQPGGLEEQAAAFRGLALAAAPADTERAGGAHAASSSSPRGASAAPLPRRADEDRAQAAGRGDSAGMQATQGAGSMGGGMAPAEPASGPAARDPGEDGGRGASPAAEGASGSGRVEGEGEARWGGASAGDVARAVEEWAGGLADGASMARILEHQMQTIGRLQDATAVLQHFNDFSQRTYEAVSGDLVHAAQKLLALRADLEYVFRKTRAMKRKLELNFPEEASLVAAQLPLPEDEAT